ncbi:MAG: NapC/NirT family cytochrome c [Deltaproteobacteria bacterium]|nr:NapC/NirT family cytochrome c [Deltaproteobacteria bacterium]
MKLPRVIHNWLSYIGTAIAILALILFVFLFVLHTFADTAQVPYAGLVIFIIVPTILLFGVMLIPIGMFFEWRYLKRVGTASILRFPIIDLNNPQHRNAMFIFLLGSIILLFLSAFSSYKAYEVTESVAFCGTLCHNVMAPEYTAYQNSPHARVRCVDCHVGPGADWFVRSKLSGAYQVYAVLFNKYPQPIPVPIENLRPAQETCEQCHWPERFFGAQQKKLIHFLPDEENTRWEINMLIKTGGGGPETGLTEGIHWHMNISNRVEYIATDEKRQEIPWVRITNLKTGKTTEYMSTENPLSEEVIARADIRKMDCMDCHNRPTHIFRPPSYSVNLALGTDKIDSTLPLIKSTGVHLLAANYPSTDSALNAIENGVEKFYQENYPKLTNDKEDAISRAIVELQNIYRNNFFPEMKVRWDIYPNNVGHLNFPGCFRCHDGLHKSVDGKVITKDCTACHTIIGQGRPQKMMISMEPKGLAFQHPEDIGEVWQEMKCSDCHTGELP